MWAVLLRAIPYALIGVGLADVAKNWFRKRSPDEPAPNVPALIKYNWIGWLLQAGVVVLILKYTNVLKKRM